jgi:hypothetical protein
LTKTPLLGAYALAVALALLWVVPANAQTTRAWISGTGDDANPCSRTAPCKTFTGAMAKTVPCGEIDALDPGSSGALLITQGVTIDGGGGEVVALLAQGANAITISNGNSSCPSVIIRNIKLQGFAPISGAGLAGISVTQGSLVLDHVDIANFTADCVNFQSSTAATLTIINSDFTNCGPAGLEVGFSGGGKVNTAAVMNSSFENSTVGVLADAFGRISLHDSMISNNTTGGIEADGSDAWVAVAGSSISGNASFGVYATNSGGVMVAGNTLAFTTGTTFKSDTGGHIFTFTNNWPYFYGALGATTTTAPPQ